MKRLFGTISMAALTLFSFHFTVDAFNLPATGQSKCYQAVSPYGEIPCSGTGQDGDNINNPMSYTDNGNGTVTDSNTGLMWQKCSVGQDSTTCNGNATAYNWYQASGTTVAIYNPTAQNVCGALNALNFAGLGDWRLPSKKELVDILDYSILSPGPSINSTYFPNTKSSNYWSLTEQVLSPNLAWFVAFSGGAAVTVAKGGNIYKYVRCVRGASDNQSFTEHGDGTVSDNKTGLRWQKCSAGQDSMTCNGSASTYLWDEALSYCNDPQAGQTGWRLPNIKELDSLTDETKYNPAIEISFFPNSSPSSYWSSTTYISTSSSAMYVGFSNGAVDESYNKLIAMHVRCVRGGNSGSYVRIMRGGTLVNTFKKLGDAYSAAADGDVIQAQEMGFPETLTFAKSTVFSFQGGYDSEFVLNPGMTTLQGILTIQEGALTVENLILK